MESIFLIVIYEPNVMGFHVANIKGQHSYQKNIIGSNSYFSYYEKYPGWIEWI